MKLMQLQKHLRRRQHVPATYGPMSQRLYCNTGAASSGEIPNLYSKIIGQPRPAPLLTHQELTTINLLIPRLCLSDQLTTAIHLAATSLPLLPPPLNPIKALSFPILVHSLASQPDMARSMSLLTILSHSPPPQPHLPDIGALLIASYLRKMRPLEAVKVYKWLRPRSRVGRGAYGVLLAGLCESGLVVEALRVLGDMVGAGVVPGAGLRRRVYEGLLKEALVEEAIQLDGALGGCVLEGANGERLKKVAALLDSMLAQLT